MRVNADFSRRVAITPGQHQWVDSPIPGVERMMLDRIGDEVARATSLVRYAPDSSFPAHIHGGGEEIFVLEGEFGDEHGLYAAGSYLRNPIGSRHAPRVGPAGSTLFVKLHQFEADDQVQCVIDTRTGNWAAGLEPGVRVMPLHQYRGEQVALVELAAGARLESHDHPGGEEILVLQGSFSDELDQYPTGSWLRCPASSQHNGVSSVDGALLYVKRGHLGEGLVGGEGKAT